ncbi:hypothetical protein Q3053_003279 [Vibrio cholerae]|uniref:hypothetical protein n=1 Tax=Vibrio vulnificus TaxID=672 RepID=UPI001B811F50|nr:hypothetical protein [Vibrio vulnificus]ELM0317004.1 hypothetical protein [Vibrio cholerae]MCJ0806751.1 hypothetical protein [Vibrio vulnificus]GHX76236.1 hypothetical protein VCSRO66_1760 [Vibrio cholerae]HBC3535359.1 hypothetical protein [Vibrio vulnificus]HBH7895072.1 hypothetical protein [Vibrio vulnificus]
MADTSKLKKVVEPWFRNEYLPRKYPGCVIVQEKLPLIWGGDFEYDAVVYDGDDIVAVYLLSCSEYITRSGKGGAGKFQKIKADLLMLLGTKAPHKAMAFLGSTMFEHYLKQQNAGRLPQDIEPLLIEMPREINRIVLEIQSSASKEVAP